MYFYVAVLITLIIFIIINYITLFICFKKFNNLLLITIVSCNRFIYLNRTVYLLTKHIQNYEESLLYTILFIDQGTKQRYKLIKQYNIFNSFLMNPSKYSYSFNLIFSYLYTKYLFILEEDWNVIEDIEKKIYHPSFIEESILILDYNKQIYGILLRELRDIHVNYSLNVRTTMGKHLVHILCNMKERYSFTNGACIYRCANLAKVKIYKSEGEVSNYFKEKNYKLGFTYKGRKGKYNSSREQSVMIHIGKNSTKSGLCNISLY